MNRYLELDRAALCRVPASLHDDAIRQRLEQAGFDMEDESSPIQCGISEDRKYLTFSQDTGPTREQLIAKVAELEKDLLSERAVSAGRAGRIIKLKWELAQSQRTVYELRVERARQQRETAAAVAKIAELRTKKEVLTGQLQLCYANTHERETEAYHSGVTEERERCAKIVEHKMAHTMNAGPWCDIRDAIRTDPDTHGALP